VVLGGWAAAGLWAGKQGQHEDPGKEEENQNRAKWNGGASGQLAWPCSRTTGVLLITARGKGDGGEGVACGTLTGDVPRMCRGCCIRRHPLSGSRAETARL